MSTVLIAIQDNFARSAIRTILTNAGDDVVDETPHDVTRLWNFDSWHHKLVDAIVVDAEWWLQIEKSLATRWRDILPRIVCIIHENEASALALIAQGALGVVSSSGALDELQRAVATVVGGGMFISSAQTQEVVRLASSVASSHSQREEAIAQLTPRERAILNEILIGHSNLQAAQSLHISVATVKFHVSNILAKLGCASRAEIISSVLPLPI